MNNIGMCPSSHGIDQQGLKGVAKAYWNLSAPEILEIALCRCEGRLSATGSLVVTTGKRTGRSPKDKFIVKNSPSSEIIDWGKINVPIEKKNFELLRKDIIAYLRDRDVFVQDCWAGADPKYRMPIRTISQYAWHGLFAHTLFVRPSCEELAKHRPDFVVLFAPDFLADPARHGVASEAAICVDFEEKLVLIAGTFYAGEMKKSMFTILNHVLPQQGVLPMHCSANIGREKDVALFFGLSGTGKTTLSADPARQLIGDDEHGWSDKGIFNFEGGCYAKCIRLSKENEPQIYNALRFATVLENVIIDPQSREPDFDDDFITENTRAAYPVAYIDNAVMPSVGGHPNHVVFLTCDAFGVLPPISRLEPDQAMYHFLSGYTAKVAGTEAGITEPQATFSTLFGAPFFTQKPMVYAKMLGERLQKHKAQCWLINTGWSGGPYGEGHRMKIPHTRAMIDAALTGQLDNTEYVTDPVFGLRIPKSCPNVPGEVLVPKNTWKDKSSYDQKAQHLAQLFKDNFKKFEDVPPSVAKAGPK